MSVTGRCRLSVKLIFAALFAVLTTGSLQQALAQNLTNHGGLIMNNQVRIFYIYWLPPGVVLDTSQADGIGNFTSLMRRFANDLSGSSYANIVTQYPGSCGPSQCVLTNGPGAFGFGGAWTDTQAYPSGRGTQANPLQDSDIQNEVSRAIASNGWTADNNSIFIVTTGVVSSTGALVETCQGSTCTFNTFCAYHGYFSSNGNNIRYAYLSDANFNTSGCDEGINTGVNGQVASDRQIALMSHELIEAITDPEANAWYDSGGAEIGDKCNQLAATVTMNGNSYNVQQEWSNAAGACVSSFGPSIKLTIFTGGDDLRDDSSAVAGLMDSAVNTFESFSLKAQTDPGWGGNTFHIAVAAFNSPSSTALARVAFTLTSHNSGLETDDNWNVDTLLIQVLDSFGNSLCSQSIIGSPAARLTGSAPTATFDTPNCQPQLAQEAVLCHVFNDGYTDMSVAADAIYINSSHQACIPDGTSTGTCRKWAGRCTGSSSGRTITMSVFDDGYTNLTAPWDAVFTNGQNQACIPDGTASGTRRKWFNRGVTNDGHNVVCTVFDDGYTNQSIQSDAVYINNNQQSCVPDATPYGRCSRWWGRCVVQ